MNFVTTYAQHLQLEAAIVEQQNVAIDHILGQVLVIQANPLLIAQRTLGIKDEVLADDEADLAVLELAHADFRPLQITQNAHGATEFGGSSADGSGPGKVILDRAMRKIHPNHIDARLNHAFENFGGRGGGAEGGNNLGMA